jgi:hypothetical protein
VQKSACASLPMQEQTLTKNFFEMLFEMASVAQTRIGKCTANEKASIEVGENQPEQ